MEALVYKASSYEALNTIGYYYQYVFNRKLTGPTHLYRIFKEHYNTTPKKYAKNIQMDYAYQPVSSSNFIFYIFKRLLRKLSAKPYLRCVRTLRKTRYKQLGSFRKLTI